MRCAPGTLALLICAITRSATAAETTTVYATSDGPTDRKPIAKDYGCNMQMSMQFVSHDWECHSQRLWVLFRSQTCNCSNHASDDFFSQLPAPRLTYIRR